MPSNAVLLGTLNRLLADLHADAPATTLVIHGAPVLTQPDFLQRLEHLVPHDQLIVLGTPDDAPLDAFPYAVSLSIGPHHADLARHGWTAAGAGWVHQELADEFGLTLPEPVSQVAAAVADRDLPQVPAPVPARRVPDPLPDPPAPVLVPPTLAERAAVCGLDLHADPGQADFWQVRFGKSTVFAGSEPAILRFLDGWREGSGGLIQ